jgi:hypothetical protein
MDEIAEYIMSTTHSINSNTMSGFQTSHLILGGWGVVIVALLWKALPAFMAVVRAWQEQKDIEFKLTSPTRTNAWFQWSVDMDRDGKIVDPVKVEASVDSDTKSVSGVVQSLNVKVSKKSA